jgi:hypothetical protein
MVGQLDSTYNATAGNREDILDMIILVSPEETPLFTRLPDASASATLHQWVEDTLATATANSSVEGFTASAATINSKARKSNYSHIISKLGAVSGTQEAVSMVGVDSEYAYELKKKMREWKLDAENVLILSTSAAGATGTARTMTGLQDCLQTNRVTGSGGSSQLSESIFNDLLQKIFEAGAVPKTAYVNGWLKRKISQFSTSNTRQLQVAGSGGSHLVNTVSVYESDFGTIQIVLDRYVPKANGYVINDDMFRKAWLRKPKTEELAKVGDLKQFMIVGEFTLEYMNERAGGVLSAFATA